MKTNEPQDDEILGRALSRAIETAKVDETPYDRSRIGMRPLKRGTSFWRVAALAASIVIAGALGSTLLERPAIDQPVGQQPSPTAPTAVSSAPTPSPAVASPNQDRTWTYFARDGLPPVGAYVVGATLLDTTPESRIASRITALGIAAAKNETPAGASNHLTHDKSGGIAVRVQGEVAMVEFDPSNSWGVRGSAQSLALIQQLVYTITEEPGIRRALITERGKPNAVIDQLVIDKPLAREDVSGYETVKSEQVSESVLRACSGAPCPSPAATRLSNTFSVDSIAPGVTRFVVQVESGLGPDFSTEGYVASDNVKTGKYVFRLKVSGTEIKPGLEIVDRTPLRSIRSTVQEPAVGGGTLYELVLDDLRPWRVAILHNPDRIVVDFGGYPAAISDTVVVYSPKPGDTGRQFTVSGLSRTFEATTAWRVVDPARKVLAEGTTTASRGTSAVWGTYQISVQMPATVSGNVTLEVFWASPRDGADTGLVQVPLTVR